MEILTLQDYVTNNSTSRHDFSMKTGISVQLISQMITGSKKYIVIDGQLLYCMKSKDIVIKYDEYKGNETEYNPSWAQSS